MSQKTYEVTLAIYVDEHISYTEDIEVEASNKEEARTIAQQKADEMERRLSKEWPYGGDIWVDVECVY